MPKGITFESPNRNKMKKLKMNPSNYKILDVNEQKGRLKSWDDNIQIMILSPKVEHLNVNREEAYKAGLCVRADGE